MNWQRMDSADEALLLRLGRIVDQIDPVPELSYQLASAGFRLRSLDSELAALVEDSLLDSPPLARVRGDSDVRLLYFEASGFGVELQVTQRSEGRSVLGEVVLGAASEVKVETMAGLRMVAIDELGRFDVNGLPAGPFRLHLSTLGHTPVTTEWVTI
jgi:hypothetical protein